MLCRVIANAKVCAKLDSLLPHSAYFRAGTVIEHIEQGDPTLSREQVKALHDCLEKLLGSQEGLRREFVEAIAPKAEFIT